VYRGASAALTTNGDQPMRDIVARLRRDGGQLTIAELLQEREAAACEIERVAGPARPSSGRRAQLTRRAGTAAASSQDRGRTTPAPSAGSAGSFVRRVQARGPVPIVNLFTCRRRVVPGAGEVVRPLRPLASGGSGGMDSQPEAKRLRAAARSRGHPYRTADERRGGPRARFRGPASDTRLEGFLPIYLGAILRNAYFIRY
jgi:hypothetical protein